MSWLGCSGDRSDATVGSAVSMRQPSQCVSAGSVQVAYLDTVCVGKNNALFPESLASPFCVHVDDVIPERSQKEMADVATERVVASMKDAWCLARNNSDERFPCSPVGNHEATIRSHYVSVALAVLGSKPCVTRVRAARSVNLVRESLGKCRRRPSGHLQIVTNCTGIWEAA
jgi:hypothetical protein